MFWSIIIIPVTCFFTKKTVDYFYPNKINQLVEKTVYNYGWTLLDKISRVEIHLSNLWFLYKDCFPFTYRNNQEIIFIKDGEENQKMIFNKFKINQKYQDFQPKYDFILHKIPIEKTNKYDKYSYCYKRYNNIDSIVESRYIKSPKCIEFTMIVVSIENSKKTYCINNESNQLNITGNILYDLDFLKWVMKKQHNVSITENDKYTVTFIDHNMDCITLPSTCYILIDENNYKIVNNI